MCFSSDRFTTRSASVLCPLLLALCSGCASVLQGQPLPTESADPAAAPGTSSGLAEIPVFDTLIQQSESALAEEFATEAATASSTLLAETSNSMSHENRVTDSTATTAADATTLINNPTSLDSPAANNEDDLTELAAATAAVLPQSDQKSPTVTELASSPETSLAVEAEDIVEAELREDEQQEAVSEFAASMTPGRDAAEISRVNQTQSAGTPSSLDGLDSELTDDSGKPTEDSVIDPDGVEQIDPQQIEAEQIEAEQIEAEQIEAELGTGASADDDSTLAVPDDSEETTADSIPAGDSTFAGNNGIATAADDDAKSRVAGSVAAGKDATLAASEPSSFRWESAGRTAGKNHFEVCHIGDDDFHVLIIGSIRGSDPNADSLITAVAKQLHDDALILSGFEATIVRTGNPDGSLSGQAVNADGTYVNGRFPLSSLDQTEDGIPEVEFLLGLVQTIQPRRVIHVRSVPGSAVIGSTENAAADAIRIARELRAARYSYPRMIRKGTLEHCLATASPIEVLTLALPNEPITYDDFRLWESALISLLRRADGSAPPAAVALPANQQPEVQ